MVDGMDDVLSGALDEDAGGGGGAEGDGVALV